MRVYSLVFLLTVVAAAFPSSALADYSTNLYSIEDKSPGLSAGLTNWPYADSPGAYYWNGVRTSVVMGFLCMILGAGVRHWVSRQD